MNSRGHHHGSDTDRTDDSETPVVLVVEDDHDIADLYTAYLEADFVTKTAYNGEQALSLLDETIDVVLLDRNLGDWSGDQLLSVIHDRKIDCQVAMITAVIPDFDITDLPIDEYVTKPVPRGDLVELVGELVLRAETDVTRQELLGLVSREIALRNEKSTANLETNEEYRKLKRRIEIAKDRLEIDAQPLGTSKFQPDSCSKCGLRWDVSIGDAIGFLKLGSSIWKCTRCGNTARGSNPANRQYHRL